MSLEETTARAFRLALAMDRMADMRCDISQSADGIPGFLWDQMLHTNERFDPGSADSLAAAVGRLWDRQQRRREKEQS